MTMRKIYAEDEIYLTGIDFFNSIEKKAAVNVYKDTDKYHKKNLKGGEFTWQ